MLCCGADLVLGVLCEVVECGDVEAELACLGELAEARAGGGELVAGEGGGEGEEVGGEVVHTIVLETEAVFLRAGQTGIQHARER